MNKKKMLWVFIIGLIFILASCTGADEPPPPTDTLVPAVVKATEASTRKGVNQNPPPLMLLNFSKIIVQGAMGTNDKG